MLKTTLPAVFALFFVGAGINHFVRTGSYLRMMPRYVPLHLAMVQISGGRSRTVRAACVRERHPLIHAFGVGLPSAWFARE